MPLARDANAFDSQTPPRARGMVMVYTIVIMTAVMGFVSFAVDFGRVQVAKTELARGADAAARYGSQGLSDGTAVAKAQAAALANTCDGTAITLLSADVSTGNWNSATKVFTANGSPTNAIRVIAQRNSSRGTAIPLLFAQVLGLSSINMTATSIATATSGLPSFGIVGIGNVMLQNGTILTDSYKSANGSYGGSNILTHGYVATNGGVTMSSGVTVNDDLYMLSGQSITANGGPSYNTRQTLSSSLSYTNVTSYPGGATNVGNINAGRSLGSGSTNTDYYCTGLNLNSGQILTIAGPVTLYINGNCTLNGTVTTTGNLPANFKIRMMSSSGVNITTTSLYADIYAPQSPININSTANIYGRIVGSQLSVSNTTAIHYDESLSALPGTAQAPTGGGSGSISMVQ